MLVFWEGDTHGQAQLIKHFCLLIGAITFTGTICVEKIAAPSDHEISAGHLTFSVYESKTKDERSAQIT